MTKEYNQQKEDLKRGLVQITKAIKNTQNRIELNRAIHSKDIQEARIEFFKIGYNLRNRELKEQRNIIGKEEGIPEKKKGIPEKKNEIQKKLIKIQHTKPHKRSPPHKDFALVNPSKDGVYGDKDADTKQNASLEVKDGS